MASFEIHGGKPLKGELIPQGAKNEALQVLCAPLLTPEKVTISNIPDIIDVNKLIALLQAMGVKVEKVEKGTYIFQAKDIDLKYLETEDFKKRDRKMVDASNLVIAFPFSQKEQVRSGTWVVIRYAKKRNTPLMIIYPDGQVVCSGKW